MPIFPSFYDSVLNRHTNDPILLCFLKVERLYSNLRIMEYNMVQHTQSTARGSFHPDYTKFFFFFNLHYISFIGHNVILS